MNAVNTGTWGQARASVRAHRGLLLAPALVLVLAGALLSATAVLIESGLRADSTAPAATMLPALAASFAGTALVVAVLVVAATVSLAMRQRRREFALVRAIGATRAQVRRAVAAELVLVTAVAAPVGAVLGAGLARLTRPLLEDAGVVDGGFRFAVSPVPIVVAAVLLVPVAVVAARLATRETLRMSPTAAVRSTGIEERAVGPARRAAAAVLAGIGLLATGSALVVPGTLGSATAAMSALLLVAAAALAGPLLVTWVLDRTGSTVGWLRAPSVRMALANSRGFSRRLTTAVVPLAAALALGTTQSSVDQAVATAATQQLRDGLHADLVVHDEDGLDDGEVAALAGLDGVARATPIGGLSAQVRTDDEEVAGLEALSWETLGMRVLPAGEPDPAYDPAVVAGSLAQLDAADTVSVSTDARLETGAGLGDHVTVRLGDGSTTRLEVVAVHDRGLGFGPYLVGAATPAAHSVAVPVDTVLLTTSAPSVASGVAELGQRAVAPATYAAEATAAASEDRLSLVLLLALLAFVGLGAANALVMSTAGRRDELGLLARTGATRRQLVAMAAVESVVVATVAWGIGSLAVVPAVLGVSAGLLGAMPPVVDLTTYAALSAGVLVIAVLSIVPTVAARVRR